MALRLAKEVHELHRNLQAMTSGQGKLVTTDIEGDDRYIIVRLRPTGGYYNGGTFDFKIEVPDDYPESVPSVICLNYIYHPNIDPTTQEYTNVCLNVLETENWCEGFGLQGCIIGLLFLLHNPNFDDPISPIIELRATEDEYKDDIRKSLNGEKVGFLHDVLEDMFKFMIPRMKEPYGCDNDTMNTVDQTKAELSEISTQINSDTEKTSELVSKTDGPIFDGVMDIKTETAGCESSTRDESCSKDVNSSIPTSLVENQCFKQHTCNSDEVKVSTKDTDDPVIIETIQTQNNLSRPESVDYDELLYKHFMDNINCR